VEWHIAIAAWLTAFGSAAAQPLSTPGQCATDSQGDQICVAAQADRNVCGYFRFPGGIGSPLYCNDVVVRKISRGGQTVYTRVLGGESDDAPGLFFVDGQDNAVVLGTTYSTQFPTTGDAIQRTYSGPPPPSGNYASGLPAGGDVFLAILAPSGDLLYSTFLGSSGNDRILGVRASSGSQVDVLAAAGGANFPVLPADAAALAAGPVLLTFDLSSRTLVRSGYLPVAEPGSSIPYAAGMRSDGTVAVATSGGLYTFGPEGQQLTFVSLETFALASVPVVSTDPAGDVWLQGTDTSGRVVVGKLIGGAVEAFRWTLPVVSDGHSLPAAYLQPPFFGPDGLAYLGGGTVIVRGSDTGKLQSTTPNALLETPCFRTASGILAVLGMEGDVKLLSYLPGTATSFVANADGSVSAVLGGATALSMRIDLTERPKAACVEDALDRLTVASPALGAGQVGRLRGGGFGPESPVNAAPEVIGRFPTSLAGLQVTVNGVVAPILAAAHGEVVFQIPFATPDGDAIPVSVRDQGRLAEGLPFAVRAAAPALVEPIRNADGTPNWFTTPASWGSTVTLFVTGAGPYSPPLGDGQVPPPGTSRRLQLPVSISFLTTGPAPEPATILYAGPAPGVIGQARIDVQLPPKRPLSSIVPQLTIGSVFTYLPSIWMQ